MGHGRLKQASGSGHVGVHFQRAQLGDLDGEQSEQDPRWAHQNASLGWLDAARCLASQMVCNVYDEVQQLSDGIWPRN